MESPATLEPITHGSSGILNIRAVLPLPLPLPTNNQNINQTNNMTSTIPTIQSASLHYREGNSDKVYHAAIEPRGEGYLVTFAYGRRGNTLTTGTKTNYPVTFADATKTYQKLIASKLAKGYHLWGHLWGQSSHGNILLDEVHCAGRVCAWLDHFDLFIRARCIM